MPIQPVFSLLSLAALLALPETSMASQDDGPASLCLEATERAARDSGVPLDVLLAISVVESGRNGQPWPWTINLGGDGRWFDSRADAQALAEAKMASGATNIDLGCFQLNYRWHGKAFASLADMLDPDLNAAYAADYLLAQYDRTGDWAAAAAAYHSATPELAERYRARFETVLAGLGPETELTVRAATKRSANGFPLLVEGRSGRNGSLVPETLGRMRLIGGS